MLGWDKVSISRTKQKAVVMFKTLNKEILPYMKDMLTVPGFTTTSVALRILNVPKPRTDYL